MKMEEEQLYTGTSIQEILKKKVGQSKCISRDASIIVHTKVQLENTCKCVSDEEINNEQNVCYS